VGPYVIENVVLKNVVNLKLLAFIGIHLVVNISKVVRYRELVKKKKVKELKLVECCGNHLSQRQMITQIVNLLVGYQVGNSQENSTRSLFLIKVLYIRSPHGPCY